MWYMVGWCILHSLYSQIFLNVLHTWNSANIIPHCCCADKIFDILWPHSIIKVELKKTFWWVVIHYAKLICLEPWTFSQLQIAKFVAKTSVFIISNFNFPSFFLMFINFFLDFRLILPPSFCKVLQRANPSMRRYHLVSVWAVTTPVTMLTPPADIIPSHLTVRVKLGSSWCLSTTTTNHWLWPRTIRSPTIEKQTKNSSHSIEKHLRPTKIPNQSKIMTKWIPIISATNLRLLIISINQRKPGVARALCTAKHWMSTIRIITASPTWMSDQPPQLTEPHIYQTQ